MQNHSLYSAFLFNMYMCQTWIWTDFTLFTATGEFKNT
jgi:hypothetical protein